MTPSTAQELSRAFDLLKHRAMAEGRLTREIFEDFLLRCSRVRVGEGSGITKAEARTINALRRNFLDWATAEGIGLDERFAENFREALPTSMHPADLPAFLQGPEVFFAVFALGLSAHVSSCSEA